MLKVPAIRRTSGGPDLVKARADRSPSAICRAAASSPTSGLLTQRAK
jgi:hypothetical protein